MLEHLFGSKTRLKLLRIFFNYPDRSFYVRELTRLCDAQINGVRRELVNLERLGIITQLNKKDSSVRSKKENIKNYHLQNNFFLYQELKNLLDKITMLEEREFVETIRKKAGKIKFLLLAGYFIQDPQAATDILIVGEINENVLLKIIHNFEKNIGKDLRYTIFTEEEFKDRREMGDKFLYNLLERPYIKVVDEYNLLS